MDLSGIFRFLLMFAPFHIIYAKYVRKHSTGVLISPPQKDVFIGWIQRSYGNTKNDLYDPNCTAQTTYDCLYKCDCSQDPMACKGKSCLYMCVLFSKTRVNCPRESEKEDAFLALFGGDEIQDVGDCVEDCHRRCPTAKHCDQCPNCKYCWLCSSCYFPSANCVYCSVCKGKASECVKCCGF